MPVDLHATPRMPPVQWRVMASAITVALAATVLLIASDVPPSLLLWAEAAVLAALWVVIAARRGREAWTARLVVRRVRAFGARERREFFEQVDDRTIQNYLERELAEHGAPETDGAIGRFSFSPIDRRENEILQWLMVVTNICVLTVLVFEEPAHPVWRSVGFSTGVAGLAAALWLNRRGDRLKTVFTASAFGLSEVRPDGRVVRLPWRYVSGMRSVSWLGHVIVEAGIGARPRRIKLPFAIVGFNELIELILSHSLAEDGDEGRDKI